MANLPSVTGNGPEIVVSIDPADIPSHFTFFRVTLTEVIENLSSETAKQITPLLALPLIAMGPLKEHLGEVGKGGKVGKGSSPHHSGVGVGVGVDVGGTGVAVGGTGVAVGDISVPAGAPHPTRSKKTNVIPIICCGNFWQLIFVLIS